MTVKDKLKKGFLLFDGGFGTMLQSLGLAPGEGSESWNISHPDKVAAVHSMYLDAGCDVVTANTFGANRFKTEDVEETIKAAMLCARKAVEESGREAFAALDIGSLGKLLKPFGELEFEDAVAAFAQIINAGKEYADLVIIETMNDLYELKAAVLAAKENCSLPVFASVVFDENSKLMTGADPAAVVATLEGLGVDALGANCSLGPKQLKKPVGELIRLASVPVLVQPNAGLPAVIDGKTVFEVGAEEFAEDTAALAAAGARILGGCCGTTPEHIRALKKKLDAMTPVPVTDKELTVISSYTHAVTIGKAPILIGERINPTGKPKFKKALRENDIDYILNEGFEQASAGAHVLDVNVGLPEIDEAAVLREAVVRLQGAIDLPLQLDSADPDALAGAMRLYNGKPLVNSVNGKAECMEAVFPLVKRYGGTVVALTLDEDGIPATAEGRLAIAERIVNKAAEYGIDKKNIIVDTLTMAVSADPSAASVTLEALRLIKERLGAATVLGVSNISFGLPSRPLVNSAFFAMALAAGLDAAIMNPYSAEMMTAYRSGLAVLGHDEGFKDYIAFAQSLTPADAAAPAEKAVPGLCFAIEKGLADKAAAEAELLLASTDPMDIINGHIIPALDTVGAGFEKNTVYLPQLLMSAEAAQSAFGVIRRSLAASEQAKKETVVLATVEGDVHDIGKNILRVLLENYGYNVIDLGRDVPARTVADTARDSSAAMVGLSALMTTTMPAMKETVALLREECPGVKIAVGGAVLNEEYAAMIGADFYSPDAMTNVRYAERIFGHEVN